MTRGFGFNVYGLGLKARSCRFSCRFGNATRECNTQNRACTGQITMVRVAAGAGLHLKPLNT